MLKHYVELLYPGIIVPETSVKAVASRDVPPKMDKSAYGYRFFDQEEVTWRELLTRFGRRCHYCGESKYRTLCVDHIGCFFLLFAIRERGR
jgi:hypothetical protein